MGTRFLANTSASGQKLTPVRVPNAERSARTRNKLILATIDCLHRYGYHATSTNVVIAHAGVSRGALLHQFSTKADLIMAVSEYIRDRRGEVHRKGLENVTDEREQVDRLVNILWAEMRGPTGIARIEIMLGSRSDPELADRFSALNQQLERAHKDLMWERAQRIGFTDRKVVDAFVQLYAAALRGLAIDSTQGVVSPDIERAVELL